MIFMQPIPKKIFHFFYRTQKVTSAITNNVSKKENHTHDRGNSYTIMTQKKELQNAFQSSKSQIYKLFEDFISNIAIRHNLFLLVFIFLVDILGVGVGGGYRVKNKKVVGDGRWQILRRA